MERVADTFDVLRRRDDALTTLSAKRKYAREVRQFHKLQLAFGSTRYDPTEKFEKRFGWDETPDLDGPSPDATGSGRFTRPLTPPRAVSSSTTTPRGDARRSRRTARLIRSVAVRTGGRDGGRGRPGVLRGPTGRHPYVTSTTKAVDDNRNSWRSNSLSCATKFSSSIEIRRNHHDGKEQRAQNVQPRIGLPSRSYGLNVARIEVHGNRDEEIPGEKENQRYSERSDH